MPIAADQLAEGVVTVFKQSVEIVDAQIKTLPTTPIVVVPATEVLNYEGSPIELLVPFLCVSRVVVHEADYDNINASCVFGFDLGSDDSFTYSCRTLIGTSGTMINTAGGLGVFQVRTFSGGDLGEGNVAFTNNLNASLLDNAIVFFANNQGDGPFGGGHPSNKMRLTVLWAPIGV